MQESIYVGLDLGSSRCQQAAINGDDSLIFSRVVPTSERNLRSAFAQLGEARVHLEAGELSDWVSTFLRPMVRSVTVSHPRSLPAADRSNSVLDCCFHS